MPNPSTATLAILALGLAVPAQAQMAPTPQPAATAATAPAGGTDRISKADEVTCRRLPVTGSLVRKVKACRTNAEWRRLAQSGNEAANAIADYSRNKPGGQ